MSSSNYEVNIPNVEEDNKESVSNGTDSDLDKIDFELIYKNLETQKIKGKYLSVFDKNDLRNLGFKLFKHQIIVEQSIEILIKKYPIKKKELQIEGSNIQITNNDNIDHIDNIEKYSNKYICPITNKLFVEPVIAYDGNIYEKEAIIEYLRKNKCTPLNKESKLKDNKQIELIINMLFTHDSIKQQIKKLEK